MSDDTIAIEIAGGVRMVVPADPRLLSTYIFLEQEDWFEDETGFVRRLAAPGGRMLDIGANLGVYGLIYAKAAGPEARVWAFEPTPHVAALARRSAAINGARGYVLAELALGAENGRARLQVDPNSEFNEIRVDAAAGLDVALMRLDDAIGEHAIANVDFVKLDVEGHEDAVVRGGSAFFARESPLVMLEVKAGDSGCDFTALDRLAGFGYAAYRLARGPDVLIPFDRAKVDLFLLNVFACKPDRAAQLAAAGMLVDSFAAPAVLATRAELERALVSMPAFAPPRG
jgi:FkbM family methyltransferase